MRPILSFLAPTAPLIVISPIQILSSSPPPDMPKARTPTQLLAINGGLAKNPGRYADRVNEPQSNGPVGNAPDYFDEARNVLWVEIVSLVPDGVLQRSDRLIVELTTHLMHDLRTGQADNRTIAQLRASLASLGMSPSDRSRVSAAPANSQDDPMQFLR